MAQQIMGRAVKNLEPPRPLKSTIKQSHVHLPVYEVQSIEELITLTENVATALSNGTSNAESMNALLSNLKLHGSQLENISKDTLDRAFVIFRNASQDERLNIMTRLNLLELIELRAKSWQISDGINSYYKSKATNVEPEMTDSGMLGTSPSGLSLVQPTIPSLNPGELIRASGKFPKPTKIPGKNYSKDEIVIRNADSGKVMGIKGRRVHMIEELSETIISFQRVNPGAKERLVQITGPSEEKINYAKQLIEDTIRRNASPVRLDTSHDGSCSSLASSASDDIAPRVSNSNRNSIGGTSMHMANSVNANVPYVPNQSYTAGQNLNNNYAIQYQHSKLNRSNSQTNGPQVGVLLHSFSTNDASLGEYKYTVNVGQHSIKITGDCFDLVRVAKLVLDDYFSSNEFLASYDTGSNYELSASLNSMVSPVIPPSHQLITSSPFVDRYSCGVSVDLLSRSAINENNVDAEPDDDVFIVENPTTPINKTNKTENASTDSSGSSNSTIVTSTPNALSRSRRSHFSRKDSAPDGIRDSNAKDDNPARIVHEYERLIYFSKSPHSWALPRDWIKICEKHPHLVRNKDIDDEKNRFDGEQFLEIKHIEQAKVNEEMEETVEQPVTIDLVDTE